MGCSVDHEDDIQVLGHAYGPGEGVIWLDDVICSGWERAVQDCIHPGWNIHNCSHDRDVSIVCTAEDTTDKSALHVFRLDIYQD